MYMVESPFIHLIVLKNWQWPWPVWNRLGNISCLQMYAIQLMTNILVNAFNQL